MTSLKTQIFRRFSLDDRRSYNSDYYPDSDSVASENQPSAGLLHTRIIPKDDPRLFYVGAKVNSFLIY